MKKILVILTTLFLLIIGNIASAQKVFRSTASGNYNSYTIWEISTTGPSGSYSAAPSGTSGGTNFPDKTCDVIIQSGHTVILTITLTVKNLTINSGGTIKSDGTARSFRPYGDAANPVIITNNGTFGGTTTGPDAIVLEAYNDATSFGFTLTGTGVTQISRIRMVGGSANPTHTVTVVLDQNVILTQTANYALTTIYNPTAGGSDIYTLTINTGKTVTLPSSTAYINNNTAGLTGTQIYTYNINGTLDNSANVGTVGITTFGPGGSGTSTNVNVNGIFKIGSFATSNNSGNTGSLALIIKNGGTVDATSGGTLTFDPSYLFMTEGTGKLVRNVGGGTDITFPVAFSTSNNTVILNNSGVLDNFAVTVSNMIDNTPPANVVNRQWTINEGTAGGTNATLGLSWITADQSAGFNPAQAVAILRWNGTAYESHAATVTGAGTQSSPYIATASSFTAFSPFIVANMSVLPISFQSSKAYQKNTGIQVEWSTAQEINVSRYVAERSANGNTFTDAGFVNARGNSSTVSSYTWFDASPLAGNNFYRIKAIDVDGNAKATSIMKVNISSGKPSLVISPNPVRGNVLSMQLGNAVKGIYTLALYNTAGQKIFTGEVISEGGSSSQSVQLPSSVKPGTYNLQLNNADLKLNKTIVVE